ncbi:MAG: cell division protein FtsA, partial [Pseudorhodobacter sp.]
MTDLYQTQRAMRNIRKAAMQRGVIAILDIGSSKVGCLILRLEEAEGAREMDGVGSMAGQSSFRVIGAATTRSRGVRLGEISVMNETERAIRTAVQSAQKMAAVRVDHVIACFSGAEPRSYGLAGEWELQDSVVSEQDVARVLAACEVPDIGEGREVLHAQPVNFALDHRSGLGDPRGQIGNRLSCDLHMMTVDAAVVQNLIYCLKRCDLELAGMASSAYVSGISSLVEDEQELGAACIDMGGGATGISVFMKKHMIYADAVRMGGDHVTSDISKGLQVPLTTAERIKTKFGGVHATGMDDREMIEIGGDSGDWEKDRRQVSRTEVIGIMRPRVEEILEEARARLDAAGFDHLPSQQIVLTGGASQI